MRAVFDQGHIDVSSILSFNNYRARYLGYTRIIVVVQQFLEFSTATIIRKFPVLLDI